MHEKELRRIFKGARNNAKARRIGNSLAYEDILKLWEKSGGRCSITGIEFDLAPSVGKRRPFAPSLDRIDSGQGYSVENCRLVCTVVNYAMSDWGLPVLRRIAEALLVMDPNSAPAIRVKLPGVSHRRNGDKMIYEATISYGGTRKYLGRFPTEWEAHRAWKLAKIASKSHRASQDSALSP